MLLFTPSSRLLRLRRLSFEADDCLREERGDFPTDEQLLSLYDAEEDVSKFYEKGNKASAVRIRKAMQEVKKLAQDLRVHVQDTKNNM